MGLQFSLLSGIEPNTNCMLLRQRDRATLAINPFRSDSGCMVATGVALVTGAPEAVATHQRVAEGMWRDSIKGAAAAKDDFLAAADKLDFAIRQKSPAKAGPALAAAQAALDAAIASLG